MLGSLTASSLTPVTLIGTVISLSLEALIVTVVSPTLIPVTVPVLSTCAIVLSPTVYVNALSVAFEGTTAALRL